jgi:hypothetical protein
MVNHETTQFSSISVKQQLRFSLYCCSHNGFIKRATHFVYQNNEWETLGYVSLLNKAKIPFICTEYYRKFTENNYYSAEFCVWGVCVEYLKTRKRTLQNSYIISDNTPYRFPFWKASDKYNFAKFVIFSKTFRQAFLIMCMAYLHIWFHISSCSDPSVIAIKNNLALNISFERKPCCCSTLYKNSSARGPLPHNILGYIVPLPTYMFQRPPFLYYEE